MTSWYRLALTCALVPMLLGTGIFAAWLVSDLDWLELAGLLSIYLGLALFAVGLVSLLIFVSRGRAGGTPYRKRAVVALAILIANFPLCALYLAVAFAMESAHLVTFVNRADLPIDDLRVTDPAGQQFYFGTVAPGQVRDGCLDIAGEGSLRFTLEVGGEPREGTLIGYLSPPLGSRATLRLSDDLSLEVSEAFERIAPADFLRHCLFGQRDWVSVSRVVG